MARFNLSRDEKYDLLFIHFIRRKWIERKDGCKFKIRLAYQIYSFNQFDIYIQLICTINMCFEPMNIQPHNNSYTSDVIMTNYQIGCHDSTGIFT